MDWQQQHHIASPTMWPLEARGSRSFVRQCEMPKLALCFITSSSRARSRQPRGKVRRNLNQRTKGLGVLEHRQVRMSPCETCPFSRPTPFSLSTGVSLLDLLEEIFSSAASSLSVGALRAFVMLGGVQPLLIHERDDVRLERRCRRCGGRRHAPSSSGRRPRVALARSSISRPNRFFCRISAGISLAR